MAVEPGFQGVALLFARVLYGGLLAFQGANHFLETGEMAAYAEAKGVPAPRLAVLGSGALLILGGLGVTLGVYPSVVALLLALFFAGVTPKMRDFWVVPDEEAKNQLTHFLKNLELLGASFAFAVLGRQSWAYALNVGL